MTELGHQIVLRTRIPTQIHPHVYAGPNSGSFPASSDILPSRVHDAVIESSQAALEPYYELTGDFYGSD